MGYTRRAGDADRAVGSVASRGFSAGRIRRSRPARDPRPQVSPPNASSHTVPGHIVFVDPEIDPGNAQIRIWVEIENPELRLRPGMRAWLDLDQFQP